MIGVCNCGAVSFSVDAEALNLYQCHCSLCRKQSGSNANAATLCEAATFKWLKGQDSITVWKKDSGFNSHFCKNCGSPVPNSIFESTYMWVPVGLIENVKATVVAHICCGSKSDWDDWDDHAKQYADMPENMNEFIKLLHNG